MSAQALAVLRHIRRVEQALEKYREPIEAQPFLDWCTRREDQIRREIDHYPAITGSRAGGAQASGPQGIDPRGRLAMELGWDPDTGCRRLWRWRNENIAGLVERAQIEDALHHADVDFYNVYPDLVPSGAQRGRVGQGRRMTDDEIRAAHVVYEHGLSIRELGELLYKCYGYASAESCSSALRKSFANLGLPRRDAAEVTIARLYKHGLAAGGKTAPLYKRWLNLQRHGHCTDVLKDGSPCPRAAKPGMTVCGYHAPDEIARRRAQMAAINASGRNVLRWAGREAA